jgi:hypothetical protein
MIIWVNYKDQKEIIPSKPDKSENVVFLNFLKWIIQSVRLLKIASDAEGSIKAGIKKGGSDYLNCIAFTGCIFLTNTEGIINTRKQTANVPKQIAPTCHHTIFTAASLI